MENKKVQPNTTLKKNLFIKHINKLCYVGLDIFRQIANPKEIAKKFYDYNLRQLTNNNVDSKILFDKIIENNILMRIAIDYGAFIEDVGQSDDEDEEFLRGKISFNVLFQVENKWYDFKNVLCFNLDYSINSDENIEKLRITLEKVWWNSNIYYELYCETCLKNKNCQCKIDKILKYDDICSICHEQIKFIDKKILKCGHQLHRDCFDKCKEKLCPLCREPDWHN